ncbi:unnamed protein product [Pneumocystis jirovecii]|uniref:DNA-directed RNA polymerase subunit n=2 Tax=Pneumocystis jirovecii TaxID=42068 RepID=L0PDC8_PNEJI|nr:DNA-directed RNA polymerase I subunit RPA43 [Pneumocystis jirovecii RU7]KTW32187.1 hypothetical protein T551_00869 [Pneumocystis jirovecii RU7]CCJ29645.1 unnamed protein product [Pneumocystis jirovecii]
MSKEHKKSKKRKHNEIEEKTFLQEIKKKRKKESLKNKSTKNDMVPINPFYCLKIESYISIPPIYSSSPMKGVEYYLDTMILSYLPNIQGIMLAHRNCEFIDKTAKIYHESPFAFAWVQFEMLVWKTKTGDFLEGIVNLQSPSHIGLLVSGFFNASIPKSAIPKAWMYQEIMSQEEVEQNENGYWIDQNKKAVKIGDKISFWTVKLETIGGIVSIEGTLLSKNLQTNNIQ